jgi:hypothetical protein
MRYVKKIFEIFNTKNYTWIPYQLGWKAKFIINDETYYVCFDEIKSNVINHYFYLDVDGKKFKIVKRNDNREFKVFSNVKHIVEDFLKNKNPYVEFIGFSSYENERHDLYMLYGQYLSSFNNLDKFEGKEINNNEYFFIYSSKISELIAQLYISEFIKENDNKKNE